MLLSNTTTAFAATKKDLATSISTKVTVDGKAITVRTFEIGFSDTIYVKVHDIAKAVSATKKKFSVTVDTKKNTMTLKPGKAYKVIGGENKKYTQTKDYKTYGTDYSYNKGMALYNNTKKQNVKVYLINNEYYVAFKSLAKIVNVSLGYNSKKSTYEINTKYGYGESTKPVVTPKPEDTKGLLKSPFPNAAVPSNPKTLEDAYNIIGYMAVNNIMDYSFDTDISYDNIFDKGSIFRHLEEAINVDYTPEIFYGAIGKGYVSATGNGGIGTTITIKFVGFNGQKGKELEKLNKEYFDKTKAAVQSLIDSGKIKEGMTEKERAHAVMVWITENVTYVGDPNGANPTGYNAIVNGKTLCSGYTALYQLMCRYVGIYEMQGVVGRDRATKIAHMWTAQVLDGKKVMTDPTWSDYDNGSDSDLREYHDTFFAKSIKFFSDNHIWDTEEYSKWN